MKEHFKQKIANSTSEAIMTSQSWKNRKEKLVFTNGCFDLIHPGHLEYLLEARNLGTKLIIGLNDDDSVMRLKGKNRPINSMESRALFLSALEFVDMVVPFYEDTPELLIKAISPDILVKGGDYEIENIIGANYVIQQGGEVRTLKFVEGHSTTNIIETIINRFCHD